MKKIIDITDMHELYDASKSGYADFQTNLVNALSFCKRKKAMTKIRIAVSNIRYRHGKPIRVTQERVVCVRFLKRKYKELYAKEFNAYDYFKESRDKSENIKNSAMKEKAWGSWIIYKHLKNPEQYPAGKILIM